MIVKTLKFTNNLVFSLILFFIIATSFVSTLALSPDSIELFGADTGGVLGVDSTIQNSIAIPILGSEKFNIESIGNIGNKYKITSDNQINSKISDKIFILNNSSSKIQTYRISLETGTNNLKYANFGISLNDQEQVLLTADYNLSGNILINIAPNQNMDLYTFIDYKEVVNYPVEFSIEVTSL